MLLQFDHLQIAFFEVGLASVFLRRLGTCWGEMGQFNMDQVMAPGTKSDTFQISSNLWSMMAIVLILESATASTLRLGTGENRGWLHGVLGI